MKTSNVTAIRRSEQLRRKEREESMLNSHDEIGMEKETLR
jgi:hypothetical protein